MYGRVGGNGALIPLGKWFNMTAPGEYSVLVSLPFPQSNDNACVAKPFKVKVAKPGDDQLPKRR